MDDKQNDGKKIETATAKAFKKLTAEGKCVMTRLHDTKSAAFFLPPSPGDFMGTAMGRPVLVECKSSDARSSFSKCSIRDYVKPTQFGYHTLWLKQRSASLFIFHSVITGDCEFWDGKDVLHAYTHSAHLDKTRVLAECPITPKLFLPTIKRVLELI